MPEYGIALQFGDVVAVGRLSRLGVAVSGRNEAVKSWFTHTDGFNGLGGVPAPRLYPFGPLAGTVVPSRVGVHRSFRFARNAA